MNLHLRCVWIVVLAGAFALTCVRNVQAQAASEPSQAKGQSAGKAIVIISVTHDEDTGNKASTSFYVDSKTPDALIRQHVLSSRDTVLGIPRPSDFEEIYGRVYIFELTAGAHEIDAWQTFFPWARLAPVAPPPPLQFEVADGEIVYLGNLNMVNRLARPSFIMPWVPVGGTPEVRDRRQVDLPIAEKRAPEVKGKVQVRLLPLGTWGPQDPQTETRRWSPPIVITK